jgi:tetratricopeptide (TPR) repeat protein
MLMTLGISLGPLFEREGDRRKKILPLIVGLTSWIALILTASRAGIIGSFLVVGARIAFYVAAVVSRRRHHDERGRKLSLTLLKWAAGSVLIIAGMIAGVIFVGQGRVLQRFAELPEQIEGTSGVGFRRPDVWEATSGIIQEHYLYGTGFGGFRYAVSQFIDIAGDIVPQQAHNDYLEFVASGGVISAALFVWFAWMLFREMSRSRASGSTRGLSPASIGAVCGIVGVAFHSLADFGLQYVGNVGFFIALIAIAISPTRTLEDDRPPSSRHFKTYQNVIAIILGIALCGICAVFGISRYALIDRGNDVQSRPAIKIPFDAEYYAAIARRSNRAGANEAALDALRNATRLRDHDYSLWLKRAQLEVRAGNEEAAEASYRNAISLAPLYGEPHFYYGLFLVERSRNVDAINELVFSARRDRRFLDAVLETIWGRSTYVPDYLQYLMEGGRYETNEGIMRFLIGKKEYELMADLSCRVELSDIERDVLIRQLLEQRSVRPAWKIYRHECQNVGEAYLIDGDFETSEVRKGAGFGWLIGDELKRSNVGIDRGNKAHGQQSLKFTFDGDVRSFFLKQTIPVRKNARYKLSFSYRSNAIISGGTPVLQVVTKQSEGTDTLREAELLPDQVEWQQKTLAFETNDKTEAIDVILTKRSCSDPKCPIFGELWVDYFEITELSSSVR